MPRVARPRRAGGRAALALLLVGLGLRPAGGAEFQKNELWGTIKTGAYQAEVQQNGSYAVQVEGGLKFNCSLIRCWVAYQRFPQVKLLDAWREADAAGVTLRFRYFWDGGRVEETLRFEARTIEAQYAYTALEKRNTQFVCCLIDSPGRPPAGLQLSAMREGDEFLTLNAAQGTGRTLMTLAFRGSGPEVDFSAAGEARWLIEKFPSLRLHNGGRAWRWKSEYEPGETLELGYRIFLARADGGNLPTAPVAFAEKSPPSQK